MDKDDEERSQKIIEEQIARATAGKTEVSSFSHTSFPSLFGSECSLPLTLVHTFYCCIGRDSCVHRTAEGERGRERFVRMESLFMSLNFMLNMCISYKIIPYTVNLGLCHTLCALSVTSFPLPVVFSLSKRASEQPSGEEPPLGDGLMPKASDEQPSTSSGDPSLDTASAMVGGEASASGGEGRERGGEGEGEGGGGSTHSKAPPGK